MISLWIVHSTKDVTILINIYTNIVLVVDDVVFVIISTENSLGYKLWTTSDDDAGSPFSTSREGVNLVHFSIRGVWEPSSFSS